MTGPADGVGRRAAAEFVADQSWLPPGQVRTGSRFFWCARSVATQLSRRRDEPDGSVELCINDSSEARATSEPSKEGAVSPTDSPTDSRGILIV